MLKQQQSNFGNKPKPQRKPRQSKPVSTRTVIPTMAPTLNQVQNNSRVVRPMNRGSQSPYMHCRMNAYTSKGNTAIPDGKNSKFIVVDHFIADTITTQTASGFTIQTYPMLPFSAGIRGNGANTFKDINVNGLTYTNSVDHDSGLYPLGVPTEWSSSQGLPGDLKSDPYAASSGRIVSITRRLMYLSPSQTATGVITVTPRTLGVQYGNNVTNSTNALVANTVALNTANSAQVYAFSASNGTPLMSLDTGRTLDIAQFTRDSISTRVENGVVIRGKTVNSDHELRPVVDTLYGAVQNVRTTAPSAGALLNNLFITLASNSGQALLDESWQSQVITVTGALTGSVFRFETVICVEYALGQTSNFAPLSRAAVQPQPDVVKHVDTALNALPVAIPGANSIHIDPR